MSRAALDLARRAVACRRWRWMPGMLAIRWTGPCRGSHRYTDADVRAGATFDRGTPDLTDPATLGCLLALVREAWEPHRGSDHIASTMHTSSGWGVGARFGPQGLAAIVLPTYETEAEALVAALEAAP